MSDTLRDEIEKAWEDALVDSRPYSERETLPRLLSAVLPVVERFVSSLPQDPEAAAMENRIRALAELEALSSPGPWYREYARIVLWGADRVEGEADPDRYVAGTLPSLTITRDRQRIADAEFIVAAVNLVRELLPVVVESCPPVPTQGALNA